MSIKSQLWAEYKKLGLSGLTWKDTVASMQDAIDNHKKQSQSIKPITFDVSGFSTLLGLEPPNTKPLPNTEPLPASKPAHRVTISDSNARIFSIEDCKIQINGLNPSLAYDDKVKILEYLEYCYIHFMGIDPSRVLSTVPQNISVIEIQMNQSYEYDYNDDRPVNKWHKKYHKLAKKKALFNKNKTELIPKVFGKKENSVAANGENYEIPVYFEPIQHIQVKNLDKTSDSPDYWTKTPIKVFNSEVQHIRINDKFFIGSLTKLDPERRSDKPIKTTPYNFKSGYFNGYSKPFKVVLKPTDYLAKQLGANKEVTLIVRLEANDKLALYKVTDTYRTNVKYDSYHEVRSHNQDLQKLVDLGDVITAKLPTYQWIPTDIAYQSVADELNKYRELTTLTTSTYVGITVLGSEVKVGKRVLVVRKNIGDSLQVTGQFDNKYRDKQGDILPECQWLYQLMHRAVARVLQPNAKVLKDHIPNTNTNSTRNMLKAVRKCIANAVNLPQEHGYCYATGSLLLEHLMRECKLDRTGLIHWCKNADRAAIETTLTGIGLSLPIV